SLDLLTCVKHYRNNTNKPTQRNTNAQNKKLIQWDECEQDGNNQKNENNLKKNEKSQFSLYLYRAELPLACLP
uniref:Ovule protein n=1 Tax=Romanomermis culicivorax TaxID=13658 RepID=A0A915L6B6_ROMCU